MDPRHSRGSATCGACQGCRVKQNEPVFAARGQHKHLSAQVPLQLGTAGGDLMLDPPLSVTFFDTAGGEKDGYFRGRCCEGYGVLTRPKGSVTLERSGGLDHLVGSGEERTACPTLLTPGLSKRRLLSQRFASAIGHSQGGHLEIWTRTSMHLRGQHRRQGEEEKDRQCGLRQNLPMPHDESVCWVALRRERRVLMLSWRWHTSAANSQSSDGGHAAAVLRGGFGHSTATKDVTGWVLSTIGCGTTLSFTPHRAPAIRTPQFGQECVCSRKRGTRCLLPQENAPVSLWPEAAEHANEVDNPTKRPTYGQNERLCWSDTPSPVKPTVIFRREKTKFAATVGTVWRSRSSLEHPTVRRGSLDPVSVQGLFVGWN